MPRCQRPGLRRTAGAPYPVFMPVGPCCPKCLRPMRELGIRYSGWRIVPRQILSLKGVEIRGDVEGIDYACLRCRLTLHRPGLPPDSRSLRGSG